MKIFIAEEYTGLTASINKIPEGRYTVEETYCNNRNVVERVRIEDYPLVIKRYKRPTIANCFIYTFLRKSKAQRSYEHAQRLLEAGIETARPVAYIEIRHKGLFHTGYFISEYLPYSNLIETYESQSPDEQQLLVEDFVRFTLRLHEAKILPLDYNPGNILVHHEQDGYHFALVDINRMQFGRKPTLKQVMKSFVQLCEDYEHLSVVLPRYLELSSNDMDKSLFFVLQNRLKQRHRNTAKSKLKCFLKIGKASSGLFVG